MCKMAGTVKGHPELPKTPTREKEPNYGTKETTTVLLRSAVPSALINPRTEESWLKAAGRRGLPVMFCTASWEDSGLSPHPMNSPLALLTRCVHPTLRDVLTDIFPSFIVTVRANPGLGPRNGEVLWGAPILKRKHSYCSTHSTSRPFPRHSPLQAGQESNFPSLPLSPPLPCTPVSCPNPTRQITGK